jgi:hypothetical protein
MVHVRSTDGIEHGMNTDFNIYLTEPLTCLAGEHFLMSLSSAQIPYSFYNIQSQLNNIIFIDNIEYAIPQGNYNVNTLSTAFKLYGIDLNFSGLTGKYTISSNRTLTLKLTENSPLQQLGLTIGSYTLGTIESKHVINMYSFNSLYIRTPNLHSLNSFETRSGYSDILSKIEIQSSPNEFIYFEASQNAHKSLLKQREISMIHFRITGTDNRLINLNGCEFEFSIQFDVIKETDVVLVNTNPNIKRMHREEKTEEKSKGYTNVQRGKQKEKKDKL